MATQVNKVQELKEAEYRLSMGYPLNRTELTRLTEAFTQLVEICHAIPACSCITPWAEQRLAYLMRYEPRD